MAKYLIEESALREPAKKFQQARALFDVIEDQVRHEKCAVNLAGVGMYLAFDAARAVEKLIVEGQTHRAKGTDYV